jgi:hypothetical protein
MDKGDLRVLSVTLVKEISRPTELQQLLGHNSIAQTSHAVCDHKRRIGAYVPDSLESRHLCD